MASSDKAWGGRFEEATHALVEAMNASVSFDQALAFEDIAGSVAHARMLLAQELISAEDYGQIETGLRAVADEVRTGRFAFRTDREDVHMNIEGALADRIGVRTGLPFDRGPANGPRRGTQGTTPSNRGADPTLEPAHFFAVSASPAQGWTNSW